MTRFCFIVLAVAVGLTADLVACGDKFLVPGRAPRFQVRPIDRESATVLIYARSGSPLGTAVTRLSLEGTLKKAGYRPTLVSSEAELERAFKSEAWDIVMVDLDDGPRTIDRLPASSPIVLAVRYDSDPNSPGQARQRYTQVLKSPRKEQSFLDAIDRAIVARARARSRSATKSGD